MKRLTFLCGILVIVLICYTASFAAGDTYTFTFDPSDLIFSHQRGFDKVTLKGAMSVGEPGNPWLPMKTVQIAIPAWQEVAEVEIIYTRRMELPQRFNIFPAQPMIEMSQITAQKIDFTPADPTTYNLTTEYPGKLAEATNNGFLAGQHIAGVVLYPLQYIPAERRLILYTEIQIRLIFQGTTHYPAPVYYRSDETVQRYSKVAKSMVINPEEVWYETTESSKSGSQEVDFLIIIPDTTYEPVLKEFVEWKNQKDISTEFLPYDELISEYSGSDNAEKVRNAIKDYYSNNGTQWVLIVGDAELIPIRGAYIWTSSGFNKPYYIPCQLYYSDLDGDWNADVNNWFGEYGDEVDMYPDVFVGRASVSDTGEARTFVKKTLIYEKTPPTDYLTRMLFAAAYIDCPWPPLEGMDAAEIKDLIDSLYIPNQFTLTKLYESSSTLDSASFRNALNQGQNIINHDGHGNKYLINLILCDSTGYQHFYSNDMSTLTNDSLFGLFYTPSCNSAGIDTSDCIAEYWINNPNGGGIGYCGNTRSGWGLTSDVLAGPAPEFDTAFFSCIFNEDICNQGKALAQSKIGFIPVASTPFNYGDYYRFTQFTLLLLGDPTLEIWTNTPDTLTVSHASVCYTETNDFVVDVAEDGAVVTCVHWVEDSLGNITQTLLGSAVSSGGSAAVLFNTSVWLPGELIVTVTKHDYTMYQDTVDIVDPQAGSPLLIYYSHIADDIVGTENGVINPGDSASVLVTLKNIGQSRAQSVSAILTTADEYIDLDTLEVDFGNINSEATSQGDDEWVFGVSSSCPDSHQVVYKLDITDSKDFTWTSYFELLVVEADFSLQVDGSESSTQGVVLGDSVDFTIALDDTVGGFIWRVDLSNSTLPSGITASFYPDTLFPPGESTCRIYTDEDSSSLIGIHYITITGASAAGGDSVEHQVEITLFVQPTGPDSITTWYVSMVGLDSLGEGTEDLPFFTIQKGIDSADDGDTVIVEKGVYEENIHFNGKNILLTSRCLFDDSYATIESTIIDGGFKETVVSFDSTEGHDARLYGFTIRKGRKYYGGGICVNSGAGPTIERNIITLNTAPRDSSSGGIGGPAIYCGSNTKAIITRNLVYNNLGAATIFIHGADSIDIISNTISHNSLGGICAISESYVLIKNNIISENGVWYDCYYDTSCDSTMNGYGIAVESDCSWDITFNNVWGHTNFYGDTTNWLPDMPDMTDTLGNISYDPLFNSVEIADYRLSCYSPCIDSGDTADSVPPNGDDRIDMGAFEFEYTSTETICGDLDHDGCITWRDFDFLGAYLYNSGPAPYPLCSADVNCNDAVNLGDLLILLEYLNGTESLCEDCCD